MCFSAEADIVAGLVVAGVGIDTLRHIGHDREVALAAIPVVFGVHQIVEVGVWWGLDGTLPMGVARGAAWLYLAIAFGVIPILVPYAVRRGETDPDRQRLMTPLVIFGGLVAIALMIPMLRGPVSFTDAGTYISYSAPLVFGGPLTAAYVAAACGTLLLSSDRVIVIYGIFNLVVVTTLAVLLETGVISLWCVLAAVSSIAIAFHLRHIHRRDERALAAAAA